MAWLNGGLQHAITRRRTRSRSRQFLHFPQRSLGILHLPSGTTTLLVPVSGLLGKPSGRNGRVVL